MRRCWRRCTLRFASILVIQCGGEFDELHKIESARLYGNVDAYAYYYLDLLVGTPPQRVSVIVDTGSGVAAFPCSGCRHCGHHIDPAFDFGRSSTGEWIRCGKKCRGDCKMNYCSYTQSYTEGSSISGYYFQDDVRLGDTIQHNPAVKAQLGCHFNENKLFYTQKANGILGIGPRGDTLLQKLFSDKEHVQTSIFALCLAEWGGLLVVGGYNESYHTGPLAYVSLDTAGGYYGVHLEAMRVAGQTLEFRLGRAIVDSGTTYTYLPSAAYRGLRSAIEAYCGSHGCGAAQRGHCWSLKAADPYAPGGGLSLFPTVEILFGDVPIQWPAAGYMFRKGQSSTWCYSFEDDGPRASTTLGASFMLHKEVVFDLPSRRLGMAQAACPEFRERPHHDQPPTRFGGRILEGLQGGMAIFGLVFGGGFVLLVLWVLGVLACPRPGRGIELAEVPKRATAPVPTSIGAHAHEDVEGEADALAPEDAEREELLDPKDAWVEVGLDQVRDSSADMAVERVGRR